LVLLDGCEELGPLYRYLQQYLLPKLDPRVRLVLAGRHPLEERWGPDAAWRRLLHPMPLDGF
jgi:hypothetical protein